MSPQREYSLSLDPEGQACFGELLQEKRLDSVSEPVEYPIGLATAVV